MDEAGKSMGTFYSRWIECAEKLITQVRQDLYTRKE